ncbi:transcriptional regulator [Occallatibacter savannae]|uniref:transcriptional regulator n=1 Tax=Occallatibacter savannae TaxID=1002691 RepID=UPI0013A530ED|nr:helix-turn-helix domain-containing protein [Occallatibacter savannae]
MNPIQRLQQAIQGAHPQAQMSLEPPLRDQGVWLLDIDHKDKKLAIEWSQRTGFGISGVGFETFGESADERFGSVEEARGRIDELLSTDQQPAPPVPVLMARLREQRKVTQKELANRLGVSQATVSGIERREDIQLSTFFRFVSALGGKTDLCIFFADARYRLVGDGQKPGCAHVSDVRENAHNANFHNFTSLLATGGLRRANQIADAISGRRAVIEMP